MSAGAPKSNLSAPDGISPEAAGLLSRVAASSDDGQSELVRLLAELAYPGPQVLPIFHALRALPEGSRLALEFVGRMPAPIPPAAILLASHLLPVRSNPVPLRLNVAGKLLASLPDTPPNVGPVVRSISAGLTRSKTLERMLQLQSYVDRCQTLDQMVEAALPQVKLKCPRCKLKLDRIAFVKHLWKKHRLLYERGTVLDPQARVERSVAEAASETDAEQVERAFEVTRWYYPSATPTQVLQALAARQLVRGRSVPEVLLQQAKERATSLCPTCLNPIPDPTPPLPPPLASGSGRLVGEGYAVDVIDSPSARRATIEFPGGAAPILVRNATRYGPRGFAVLGATWVFGLVLLAVGFAPAPISPVLLALFGIVVGWCLYALIRSLRPALVKPDDLAFDLAWAEIVPDIFKKKSAMKFLLRLCRASFGGGSPLDRLPKLKLIEAKIEDRPNRTALDWQLLAAVRTLRLADGGAIGKDRVAVWLSAFEPFFQGEAPAVYLEAAAEILQTSGRIAPTDLRRFSVLFQGLAFEHGLLPLDLLRLLRFLPQVRQLMGQPTAEHFKLAYVVWRGRISRPWAGVSEAAPLVTLAKDAPAASRRILSAYPDALLKIELPDGAERELGDVVLTTRGLVVAGKLVSDPELTLDSIRSPRGSGWLLLLGTERVNLDRKLHGDVLNILWAWLKHRLEKLLPQAEQAVQSNPERVKKLLAWQKCVCPICQTESLARRGKVGDLLT